jgi:hypothetical protein
LLRSISGASNTIIRGSLAIFSGPYARGVYLSSNAVISGFTIRSGSPPPSDNDATDKSGGGVYCESTRSIVSNCVLTANSATYGGGVYGGTLLNCVISTNSGGGAYRSILNNCIILGNAEGGASYSTLENCTVIGNSWSMSAGGILYGSATNSIVYYNNQMGVGSSATYSNYLGAQLNYCCTWPLPTNGVGNFTNRPVFINLLNSDFHQQTNSPTINAGNNAYVQATSDFDGNPRTTGGTVDVGAYEFQNPSSIISYAWLQQYGLKTDGSADHADPDHDSMDNWQEWICGTNPTNALSVLRMFAPVVEPHEITLAWQSVSNRPTS